MKRPITAVLAVLIAFDAACSHSSTTSPSTTTTTATTTTTTTPTMSESFVGTLMVGQYLYYSFNIGTSGTMNVTLNSVGGTGVPSTVHLGLGIGTPTAYDCTYTSTVVAASSDPAPPQLTGTFGPGRFCVRVWDVGNLSAPANFNITIAHS
jgi:hypothetical protein